MVVGEKAVGAMQEYLRLKRYILPSGIAREALQVALPFIAPPSAARELALEALRSAEQFIENGFEFGFIRKPDEGDTALETLPKIKAAIRDLQSNAADARPLALEEGFRKGLEAACDVIDAHNEYDRRMCCDGRECGCYGATVHQSMQHYIRSLSSPDHADAGKVEGDGWKPIDEAAKSGRIVRIAYNRDDVTMADAFYRDGKWHAACVFYRSGVGKPPYEFREHKVLESLVFAYRPLPTPPSSEVA